MAAKMPIMEIFGPTIQGEGMVVGRKTMFIRTGGCDYKCAWCDSSFTWDGSEKATMMTAQEVFDRVKELGSVVAPGSGDTPRMILNFDHITISGGNPALIGKAMEEFIDLCREAYIAVGLETQGSRWQPWMVHISDLTISPKPPSSEMVTDWEKLDDIISKLNRHASEWHRKANYSLKVVVFNDEDYEYAQQVRWRYPDVLMYVSVGNVDAHQGGDISGRLLEKLGWLWDKIIADPEMNDVRPLPQLHTLVWANKRGV